MSALPKPTPIPETQHRAGYFNRECQCATLDGLALHRELSRDTLDNADGLRALLEERPQLFAKSAVFIDEKAYRQQADIIAAIEKVVALPAYQQRVLACASATSRFVPKALGVFFSYDFHLDENGPRLIEINTNAGGGLLNAWLARAQKGCQHGTTVCLDSTTPQQAFLAMFHAEWQAERDDVPLLSVAIVDDNPASQFLFPEFLLFQRLFQQHGIAVVICDPRELTWRDGALWQGKQRIDLVYNRLTDFDLAEPAHASLREAYLNSGVVVTPHPHAHALYADKRNLALLTDALALREWGIEKETIALLLDSIAPTVLVCAGDADRLWAGRKRLFFKPMAGYGSKGAYRGDKLTRRVFEEILQGGYVAQAFVPPGERWVNVAGQATALKFDLRVYVYRAKIQLMAARLYQGQTTNFRTPGGGFAPLAVVPGN